MDFTKKLNKEIYNDIKEAVKNDEEYELDITFPVTITYCGNKSVELVDVSTTAEEMIKLIECYKNKTSIKKEPKLNDLYARIEEENYSLQSLFLDEEELDDMEVVEIGIPGFIIDILNH